MKFILFFLTLIFCSHLAYSEELDYKCMEDYYIYEKKTNALVNVMKDVSQHYKFDIENKKSFQKNKKGDFDKIIYDYSFVSYQGSKLIARSLDGGDGTMMDVTFDFELNKVTIWPHDTTTYITNDCYPNTQLLSQIHKISGESERRKEALLVSVNEKRELCFQMGFEEETESLANCILQLMLVENKSQNSKEQTVVINNNDQQANIMNEQTKIMQRQLELQELQNTQKMMKTFQYMMDFGKMPPLGYGY